MSLFRTLFYAVVVFIITSSAEANNIVPINNMEQNKKVLIKTSVGNIVIELYNETPAHRDNFIKLVEEKYYEGTLFHRVIKQFMIQAGDGDSKNATPGQQLGAGNIGYTIPAEFVYPKFFHKRGALAAARTADQINPERESSGSQFYIVTGQVFNLQTLNQMIQQKEYRIKQDLFQKNLAPYRKDLMRMQIAKDTDSIETIRQKLIKITEEQYAENPVKFTPSQIDAYTTIGGAPHLDGEYTVFGEVVEGMDVVAKIESAETDRYDRPKDDIRIISAEVL